MQRIIVWLLPAALSAALACNASNDAAGSGAAKPAESAAPSSTASAREKPKDDAKTPEDKPRWKADLTPKVEAIRCDATAAGKRLALPPGGRMQEITHDARSVFWSIQHEEAQLSCSLHGVNRDGTDAHQLAKFGETIFALAVWQDDVYALGKAKLFSVPRKGGEPKAVLEGDLGGLAVHRGAALVVRDAGDDLQLVRVEGTETTVEATWRGEAKALAVAGDVAYVASAEGVSRVDLATKKVTPIALTLAGKAPPPIVGIEATATHVMVSFPQEGDRFKGGVAPVEGGALTPFEGDEPALNAKAFFFVRATPIGPMEWGPDQVMRQKFGDAKATSIRSVDGGAGGLSADDECLFIGTGIPGGMATVVAVAAGG